MQIFRSLPLRFWPALAIGFALPGCGHRETKLDAPKPAPVIVTPAVVREVLDYEEFTGRIRPVKGVDIRARVTGYLDKVLFQDGLEVKEGDVLCEIDPRTYNAEYARAEAALNQAKARQKRLQADYHRARDLRNRGANSQEEYDKVAGDLDEAVANVKSAEASRDMAKLNVDFTKVTAPFSGVLSERRIDPGNLVKADDTIITRVVTLDPIYAYFDIDERTLLKLRRLLKEGKIKSTSEARILVQLSLSDEEEFVHVGQINFADNELDAGTGTLRVRAVFQNPPTSKGRRLLSPGLFVRVRLPIGSPHKAVIVPERSLGSDQGQKFIFVVDDKDVVNYRKVKVGTLNKGFRVIEQGLKEGEKVIVNGLQRVRTGAKVEPKVEDMPGLQAFHFEPPQLPEDTTRTVQAGRH